MELKKVISLKFYRKEWDTLIDAVHVLEDLGEELQKLGPNDDVILQCVEGGNEHTYTASQIYDMSTQLDIIADGGTIITSE